MANLFTGTSHALSYSKFRPSPPPALIDHVIDFLKSKVNGPLQSAADIGCGTGHSTEAFAPYFQDVIGMDVSEAQILMARKHRSPPNVSYKVTSAEETGLADSSLQLVIAGQSLHWFNHDSFFKEVKRILIPGGVVATYGYWIPTPKFKSDARSNDISQLIKIHFHDGILGEYWDSRRITYLKKRYSNIDFPFENVTRKDLVSQTVSTVSDYMGYLSSWSAYEKLRKEDPEKAMYIFQEIQDKLMDHSDTSSTPDKTDLAIYTTYFLLMGTKPSS